MKTAFVVVAGLFGALALYALTALAGSALHIFTLPFIKLEAKVQTNEDIIKKTYNADNALEQYHYFKDLYEAIQATQNKVAQAKEAAGAFDAAAGPRTSWTFEDKQESARLHAVALGLQAQYENQTADYNARAKSVDRAVFKDNLPLFINLQ